MRKQSTHGKYTSDFGGILRRRLKFVDFDNVDLDSLVDRFRSVYPEYRRTDRELFAKRVRLLLLSCSFKSEIPRKIGKLKESGGENLKGRDSLEFGKVIWKLIAELVLPLYRQEELRYLDLKPITGILLHGPPGCGKTKLAHVIAQEARVRFYKVSATELVSRVPGVSAENIQELFTESLRTRPSIIFIDEIDVITTRMEENLPRQLMTCMDDPYRPVKSVNRNEDSDSSNGRPGCVLVIGATSRPDAIDPALRRPGRFDYEIGLGVPDEEARVQILTVLTPNLRVEGAIDLTKVARSTTGYVGADLTALSKNVRNLAMKSVINHRKDAISGEYFEDLWRHLRPHKKVEKTGISSTDFVTHEATTVAMEDIPASRHESSVDYSPDEHSKRAWGTMLVSFPEKDIQALSENVEKLHMHSE